VAKRVKGFRFASTHAGIKRDEQPDLGLIVAEAPATAAAVFTRNRVVAAPVRLSRTTLRRNQGKVSAVVVNSGNANACTGAAGLADARLMAALTAEELGVNKRNVLVASTGVIGERLPMEAIELGIEEVARRPLVGGFDGFADSILTTDAGRKVAARKVDVGGQRVTLLGCTKGAGMIAPNMATTLSFVMTDARVGRAALDRSLHGSVTRTYNAITVDGDTSTNDMVLVLASGAAGNRALSSKDQRLFDRALEDLLDELAHKLMHGGEGVHHVVAVEVTGAKSERAAQRIARAVANSPLVKTAIAGGDPNWGRVISAAGNAGVPLNPDRLDLWFDNVQLVASGERVADSAAEKRAAGVMKRPNYALRLDLNAGIARGRYLACDLSHEYVTINADYRT